MGEHRSDAFGPSLRAARLGKGWSLATLAARLHYSKGHLSKIENGLHQPTVEFARRCDVELGAEGRLAALSPAPERSRTDRETTDEDRIWLMTMEPTGGSRFSTFRRRDVLAGGVSLAGLGVTRARGGVRGGGALPHLRELFDRTRTMGQTASPALVLPMVVAQAQALRALLPDTDRSSRTELALLAARNAEYAGWMAQESGDDDSALWWTGRAVRIAAEAGDRDLAAYGLVRQALVTMYQGDAGATIELAQFAQRAVGAPRRVLGLAAQREAQGHALSGDRTACLRALDRASGHLAAAAADPIAGPVLGTSHVHDPVAVVTGWCLLDLGRPAEAAEVLDREIVAIPETAHRARVRFGVRQALAHATAGEVDRACEVAEEMLPLALAVDSETVRTDVRRLATTLRRWLRHPRVADLQPVLVSVLARV